MKRNRRLFLVALAALLVLPFVLPSVAAADTLAQKKARAHEIMGQLTTLDNRMEQVVERYDAATGKLATIDSQIAANRHTLAVTRYNLQLAKAMLDQRVVAMYKQRPVEMLDVIVQTKSFSSMVDQLNMLHRVSSSESTMVNSIASFQTTIKAAQKSLVVDQAAAQKVVAQRATEKAGVESALAARQSLLRGVKSQIAQLEAQQAQAARQSAKKSGGYVATGVATPVNPDHSSVVAFAASFVGKVPYVWGGSTPRVSTVRASPCTAGPPSASACRTTRPPSRPCAHPCRPPRRSPATSCSSAAPPTTSASTPAGAA